MRAGLAATLVVWMAACAEEPAATRPAAPVTPRAAWLLEPARIGVGQVTTLELAVATAPDHALARYVPPTAPPGLALLTTETLPVEKQGGRWVHRTRLRLRATATGESTWPGGPIQVEAPDGTLRTVALPDHPIEVVSILPEYPDRVAPFGVRAPGPPPQANAPVWMPALLGAGAALSVVGLVALARRRPRDEPAHGAAAAAARGVPPWERARQALALARTRAEDDPFEAAHMLSLTLRHFVDRRFGSATTGLSGEELRETEPPFAARSRWPELLALLAELDALRFRPASDGATRAALEARLGEWIDQGARFVEDAVPPEERR